MIAILISLLILCSFIKKLHQKVDKQRNVTAMFSITLFILFTVGISYFFANKIKHQESIPFKEISTTVYLKTDTLTDIKSNQNIVNDTHYNCLLITTIKYDSSKHSLFFTPFPVYQMKNLINRKKYNVLKLSKRIKKND